MTPKAMEKRLLEMQERFRAERDPEKQAAIRQEYRDLHRRWVAAKSQLTLEAERAAA